MKSSDIPNTSGKRETFEVMLQLEHEKELAELELKTVQAARPPMLTVNVTVASADMARASFYVLVAVVLVLAYGRARDRGNRDE